MNSFVLTNTLAMLALGLFTFASNIEASPDKRSDHPLPMHKKGTPIKFASPGHRVKSLPAGRLGIMIGKSRFFYHSGVFYRPQGSNYVVVAAPVGARVRQLPASYVTFSIGNRKYYHVNATYYLFEPKTQEYVVVDKPATGTDVSAEVEAWAQMFVYPNDGQSAQQTRQDRYECYVWASGQSGFDPAQDKPSAKQADYGRAISACLEGRGYTVR